MIPLRQFIVGNEYAFGVIAHLQNRRRQMKPDMKSIFLLTLLLFLCAVANAQAIYELPESLQTRWASPENPTGEKGRAATALGVRRAQGVADHRHQSGSERSAG
jgi:hypothetical protein